MFNSSPNAIEVFIDLHIPKSEDRETAAPQRLIANSIPRGSALGAMLTAVEFDDQARLETRKIDNVATQGNLAAKFDAMLLPHVAKRARV